MNINCVIDVGANIGVFSKHLRMMGYKGYIICFEPIIEDYSVICQLSEKDDKWFAYNYALGNENTSMPFKVMTDRNDTTVFSSFLDLKDDENRFDVNVKTVDTIEIKRLDTIFGEITKDLDDLRIFMKVDTQGFDMEVFNGAQGGC